MTIEDKNSAFKRELDHLHERIKNTEEAHRFDKELTVDLQVRVAQIEARQPIGKDEFDPIKRLVWGFVGTVLAVVLVAVLAIVVNRSGVAINIKP